MPFELKPRPSDDSGSIKRQPGFERVVPVNGSRDLAHNTDGDRRGLIDDILPKIDPLNIDSKNITTGDEASLVRKTQREERKEIQKELLEYEQLPNNPRRLRLLKKREEIDRAIDKATNFLDQWQTLDKNSYLQRLIDSGDELADQARQLLNFRIGRRGETFSEKEKQQMQIISHHLRDQLMARIRRKERGE
jgi:hypothetical protein